MTVIIGGSGTANGISYFSTPTTFGGTLATASRGISNASIPSGTPIQYFSTTFTGIGTSSGGGVGTGAGTQLYSGSFSPLRSDSKILIQVSDVCISEESNNGDWGWLAAWRDGNLLASTSGSALSTRFAGNLNVVHKTFNHTFNSWGTTSATILIRAGMNQASSYVNGQSTYYDASNAATIGISIWEIS